MFKIIFVLLSLSYSALTTAQVTAWQLTGAIAAKNQQKAWSATMNWQQQGPNQYQIRLFGPIGGGTVMISRAGGVITLQDGNKKVRSRNAELLLQQQTGVRLPVSSLYYWVRGLPAPGKKSAVFYDTHHYLMGFTQNGYRIQYTRFTEVNGNLLPLKMSLQGHGVMVKLIVKNWKV